MPYIINQPQAAGQGLDPSIIDMLERQRQQAMAMHAMQQSGGQLPAGAQSGGPLRPVNLQPDVVNGPQNTSTPGGDGVDPNYLAALYRFTSQQSAPSAVPVAPQGAAPSSAASGSFVRQGTPAPAGAFPTGQQNTPYMGALSQNSAGQYTDSQGTVLNDSQLAGALSGGQDPESVVKGYQAYQAYRGMGLDQELQRAREASAGSYTQIDPSQIGPNTAVAPVQRAGQTATDVGQGLLGQSSSALGQAAVGAIGVAGAGSAARGQQTAQLGQYGQDISALRAAAAGQGPSAAQAQLNQASAQTVANQAAVAAQARGGNVAAAQRAAARAGTQQGLQTQQQSAALRSQEQQQAMGLLAQTNPAYAAAIAEQRQTDIGQQATAAQLLGQVGSAAGQAGNGASSVGLQGLQGTAQDVYQGQGLHLQGQEADIAARDAYLTQLARQYSIASGIPASFESAFTQQQIANNQSSAQLAGSAISGIAAIAPYVIKAALV